MPSPKDPGDRGGSGKPRSTSLESLPTAAFDDNVTAHGPTTSTRASRESQPSRFAPGEQIADRYRIVHLLGQGGMGEVYRADDLVLDEPVALKFLPRELERDPEQLEQMVQEIRIARQITHPNVCRVYDLGEAEGTRFLSMEYIDGEDLLSLQRRIGRLPWDKALEIARQVTEGLAAAHAAGILHRDLKPANLMIDGEGRARITDFGLAALSDSIRGAAVFSGTPAYMAPEQLTGTEVTIRSDLYALGLTLYELFTGERAFRAESQAELLELQQEPPRPPSSLRAGFSWSVERIILACLEPRPADRPESAEEVLAALTAGEEPEAEGEQLRALLYAQLLGRGRLIERLGDARSGELFREIDRLGSELLERHGGRTIEQGELLVALFERPLDAVRWALAFHRALERVEAEGAELRARAAIHFGEMVLRRSSPQEVARGARPLDVGGLARQVVTRLGSLAEGRQILLTRAAFDLARRSAVGEAEAGGELHWLAHGVYRFADAEEPLEVFEVGVRQFAPLVAPAGTAAAARVEAEDTVLGWRPAPGLNVPHRPNWTVERKLGEGGFGEVWRVKHDKTHERRVFKFCYDAERLSSLQREITVFRLLKEELGEREDIARILDWNLEQSPYFIEFALSEGGNLLEWAEEQGGIEQVPLATRLELAAQVATALAAAHSVGVLHKDVKPANVLVESDGEGNPRAVLTDFGIGMVTDKSRLAARGITLMGMTEMQGAAGESGTVGTQLYMAPELLSGKPATIQADIYALGVLVYQLAAGELDRPISPGWERQIDDELLRDDIASFVDGSPERRPGSAAEVARRLRELDERSATREAERRAAEEAERSHRRRRLATVIAAAATVFLVVVSLLAVQALRARADAVRGRAQAEQLIDFMLTDLHESLEKLGRLDLLEGVARSSTAYFDSLTARDETAESAVQRGRTLLNIGDVLLDQGDAEGAQAAYRTALEIHRAGLEEDPASSAHRLGNVESERRLAETLAARGQTTVALQALDRALGEAERLAAERPEDPERQFAIAALDYQIAVLQDQVGHQEDALAAGLAAIAALEPLIADAGQDHWHYPRLLIDALLQVSDIHLFDNRRAEALAALEEAQRIGERMLASDPANSTWPRRLAQVRQETGELLYSMGRLEDALESLRAAAAAYRQLAVTDPTRVAWRWRLARTIWVEGWTLTDLGRTGEARRSFEEALGQLEPLIEGDPRRIDWLSLAARLHGGLARLELRAGRTAQAVAASTSEIELRERIMELSGDDPAPRNELAWSYVELGDTYTARREPELARRAWRRAVEIIAPLTETSDVLNYLDTHAQALLKLGLVGEARPLVDRLLEQGWDDPEFLALVRENGLAG